MPKWAKCETHPDVNSDTMWGCPDCLFFLRIENGRLAKQYADMKAYAESLEKKLGIDATT